MGWNVAFFALSIFLAVFADSFLSVWAGFNVGVWLAIILGECQA
jgi:hypothetical protein